MKQSNAAIDRDCGSDALGSMRKKNPPVVDEDGFGTNVVGGVSWNGSGVAGAGAGADVDADVDAGAGAGAGAGVNADVDAEAGTGAGADVGAGAGAGAGPTVIIPSRSVLDIVETLSMLRRTGSTSPGFIK